MAIATCARIFEIVPRRCVTTTGASRHRLGGIDVDDATAAARAVRDYPCIETTWARDAGGYGRKYVLGSAAGGRMPQYEKSHRAALERKLGRPILPGLLALHHCDNPPTWADNMRDLMARNRQVISGGALGRRGLMLTEAERDEIRRRYAAGDITQSALGAEFGVHQGIISNVLAGGWRDRGGSGRLLGESHHKAKLTEQDVREIRRRSDEGASAAALARSFGIGQSQAARIAHRESWRWLD